MGGRGAPETREPEDQVLRPGCRRQAAARRPLPPSRWLLGASRRADAPFATEMSMCTLSNRPTTPSGFERTLNPVSLDALIPMGLMQAPEVGAVMLDTELRIVWVNEAAERLIGGPPAAGWAGRWLGEVLPGMDAGVIERSLRRVLA